MENPGQAVPLTQLDRAFGAIHFRQRNSIEILRPWSADSPSHALRDLTEYLSSHGSVRWSCYVGLADRSLGSALVFRMRPERSLLVAGTAPMAAELRTLIAGGAAPGWALHPVPDVRTPLHELEAPLRRQSGNRRFYNALERAGFGYVEEVAAAPDEGLLELRNSGLRLIDAVRAVIAGLPRPAEGPDTAEISDTAGEPDGALPRLPAEAFTALRVVAEWAASRHDARTVADLLSLKWDDGDLPADVAQAWDRVGRLDLSSLTDPLSGGSSRGRRTVAR